MATRMVSKFCAETPPRSFQAGAKRGRSDPEAGRSSSRTEVLPRDQQYGLSVRAGQPPERRLDRAVKLHRDGSIDQLRRHAFPVPTGGLIALTAVFGHEEIPCGRDQPRSRIVGGHIGKTPPSDGHCFSGRRFRIPRSTAPRISDDQAKVREHLTEPLLRKGLS